MKYLTVVSYLYLAVAVFFIVDGVNAMRKGENYIISFLFAGLAVFMFFFRMRFAKKYQNGNKDN
ncbi:hypothetical protein AMR72_07520 [Flavobacterium psychrophilum]|nr:hypothetical protein AMR72_07520 [Flavobacterium psychrophilum]AOE52372.1 hypothetical protein ALW18_07510 [Flavobacterium psychrophilum]